MGKEIEKQKRKFEGGEKFSLKLLLLVHNKYFSFFLL